ncbi:MAG: hypothetical protein LBC99_07020 [Spirochaetota bacterium]|nr:hypothetical protein [Spirochaetota bacterium]
MRWLKILTNIIYAIGVFHVLCFVGIFLFAPDEPANPDAMLPLTWSENAVMWLAVGSIPMLLACIAAFYCNRIQESEHTKRNAILIFLPGFICLLCALIVLGMIAVGFAKHNL